MAFSSYKTFLMIKESSDYTKLIDIKDYPDLGQAPDQLDATTLSDPARVYTPGIQDTQQMEFTCNYDKTEFNKLEAFKGTVKHLAVWFGGTESAGVATPTGENGKFAFDAYVDVYVAGTGVNEIVEMKIVVTPTTKPSIVTE